MRPSLTELKAQLKDSTVFIIGGGASLRGFDYSKLDGKKVIGINQAGVYVRNLTAMYWADEDWAAKNYDTLLAHPCKLRFCGRMSVSDSAMRGEVQALGGATPLLITGSRGLDSDINRVRGNNSGSQVINLCINAGAKKIVLLGFDMKPNHWHNDYPMAYNQSIYDEFLASINSIAEAKPKAEIINCSMDSSITVFKKVPFDEV